MRKLTYKQAVQVARDLVIEGEANGNSGDPRQAAEGRRSAVIGQLLLQLVSSFTEVEFDTIKPAVNSAADKRQLIDAENNVGSADPDHVGGEA